jgi:hypothetical protein
VLPADIMLAHHMKDKLTDYLTYDKPFGPEDASLVTDPFCRSQLFQHENAIYSRLIQNPSLILGRRGSGKTAFLYSAPKLKDYQSRAELNSASAFAAMLRLIEKIGSKSIAVEPVAKIWELCFWWALLFIAPAEAGHFERGLSADLRKDVAKYISSLAPRQNPTLAQFLVDTLAFYERGAKIENTAPENLPDFIQKHLVNELTLESLIGRLSHEMLNNQVKALLIIDSLDPRADGTDTFDLGRDEGKLAIVGLLKAIGEFSRGNKVYNVRFALPSERHFQFLQLSSNPAKDMINVAAMQWTAGDLVCLAAHRLNLFYREHAEFSGHYASRYSKLDTSRRKDAVTLLESAVGRTVQNSIGVEESTISYIMRHTQLLPRHVLLYLNSIFVTARKRGENFESISGNSIREGITRVEQTICYEVFAAYKHLYPAAPQLCVACIPELRHKFAMGDLQSVFNWHGKRLTGSGDFDQFKRMLIEMGIIGRYEKETDVYYNAKFEYSSPHQLVLGTTEYCCIHPVFGEIYSARDTDEMKVVYPHGSDTELD